MKKLFTSIGVAVLGLAATSLHAQSTNTPTSGNIVTSMEAYFSSFDTNADMDWTNTTWETSTGYKQVTGVNASSTLDGQRDFGKWNAGLAAQFSGVGSPINTIQAQGG